MEPGGSIQNHPEDHSPSNPDRHLAATRSGTSTAAHGANQEQLGGFVMAKGPSQRRA